MQQTNFTPLIKIKQHKTFNFYNLVSYEKILISVQL